MLIFRPSFHALLAASLLAACGGSQDDVEPRRARTATDMSGTLVVEPLRPGDPIQVVRNGVRVLDARLGAAAANAEAELDAGWTTGDKKLLVMLVDFSDLPGPLATAAETQATLATADQWYRAASYGKTSLTTSVTPVLRLPRTAAEYTALGWATGGSTTLMADAKAAALAAGAQFDAALFDLHSVVLKSIWPIGPFANIGASDSWMHGNVELRSWLHELGHNYGLPHANRWNTGDASAFDRSGSSLEYGNSLDVMGGGSDREHFNTQYKSRLQWITPERIGTVTQSGTYRLEVLDGAATQGALALKIPGVAGEELWLEARQSLTDSLSAASGIAVTWESPSWTTNQLLGMNNGYQNLSDPGLQLGRTFSDFERGVHVTPLQRLATSPPSLDVRVNFGAFPGNRAPTLTVTAAPPSAAEGQPVTFQATASDPDGDPLTYAWTFNDDVRGPNAPTVTHTRQLFGREAVKCTVSDGKGGTASKVLVVPVGQQYIVEDGFDDGDDSSWTRRAGTWAVVQDASSGRVYRQSATSGTTFSTWSEGSAWFGQVVSARVRPNALNATDSSVRVLSRYVDDNNYYALSLHRSGRVDLLRRSSGQSQVLSSASFPVSTNTWYTLTLSVVGGALEGHVDGTLLVAASDATLTSGRAALSTVNATADFDGIFVSAEGFAPNLPPAVDMPLAISGVASGVPVALDATTSDDGIPAAPHAMLYQWKTALAPAGASVSFGSANTEDTTATFSAPGTYLLRLLARDGNDGFSTSSFGEVRVDVAGSSLLFSDDFESGTGQWTALSGSWSAVADGSTTYAQTNTSGSRQAVAGASWGNQSVSAKVKVVSFNGSDRYVTLIGRYQDASNYYYLALRKSGKLELKKVVNGSTSTIGSKSFTVTVGAWYSLELKLIGTSLQAYVNGNLELSGSNTQIASGKVGLGTYYTSARFDDVKVAPQ